MSETASPTQTPTPAPNPAFQSPPATSGASLVQITAEEFARLNGIRGDYEKLQAKHTADLAAKETERLTALAKAGEVEKALAEQQKAWESKLNEERTSYARVKEQYHAKEKSAVIAAALVGREFAGDKPEIQAEAAAMFRSQIEPLFETFEAQDGSLIVREKGTGRPAAQVLPELLNAPKFQLFFAPKSRGGSGTDATRPAGVGQQPGNDGNPHQIGTREWAIWKWQQGQKDSDPLWRKPKN